MDKYKYHGKSYEGFETLAEPVKKSFHYQIRILCAFMIFHFILYISSLVYFYDNYTIRTSFHWLFCKGVSVFFPYAPMLYIQPDGTELIVNAKEISTNQKLSTFANYYLWEMLYLFRNCGIIYLPYLIIIIWARKRSRKLSNKKFVSGANLISSKQFKRKVRKKKDKLNIPCGKVKMPLSSESKHCLMMGIDSARDIFVCQLIQHLKKNNQKCIVYDPLGNYLSRFYNPETDYIFNPIDTRTLGWTLINEIETEMDIDAITSCLLSDISNAAIKESVKSIYSGIFKACRFKKKDKNMDIYKLLSGDFKSISESMKGIDAAKEGYRHIKDHSSRHAMSVFPVITQYAKCFEYMKKNDGPFNIKKWLKQPGGSIFVSSNLNYHDKLTPVLTLFLDLLCQRLLSFSAKLDHSVYYIFNNFISLKKKNYLMRMLLASELKGGRVFLGCSDFDQIDDVYRQDGRHMIVSNCGNYIFFQITNPVSAKRCSEIIGETEFFESKKQLIGIDKELQKKREPLIFATDFINMDINKAVVRFSGYKPLITTFPNCSFKEKELPFIKKTDL